MEHNQIKVQQRISFFRVFFLTQPNEKLFLVWKKNKQNICSSHTGTSTGISLFFTNLCVVYMYERKESRNMLPVWRFRKVRIYHVLLGFQTCISTGTLTQIYLRKCWFWNCEKPVRKCWFWLTTKIKHFLCGFYTVFFSCYLRTVSFSNAWIRLWSVWSRFIESRIDSTLFDRQPSVFTAMKALDFIDIFEYYCDRLNVGTAIKCLKLF